MSGQIKRGNQIWARAQDGGWLLWDPATGSWRATLQGPPPPPPPPPSTPVASGAGGSFRQVRDLDRRLLVPVLVSVCLAVVLLVWSVVGPQAEGLPTSAAPVAPSGTSSLASERSIYEIQAMVPSCFKQSTSEQLTSAVESMPAAFNRKLKPIASRIAALRELNFKKPVKTVLERPDKIGQLAVGEQTSQTKRQTAAIQVLEMLGAISEADGLVKKVRTAVSSDILGFYRPSTKTIYARRNLALDPLSEVTIAHELEHALMDQRLGLPLSTKAVPVRAEDEQAAARALVEGDAQLVTQNYMLFHLDRSALAQLQGDPSIQEPATDTLPYILEQSFLFPYSEGMLFACYLFATDGGWAGVDAAYEDPPRSTAEILFPDRYGSDFQYQNPPDPRRPDGWERSAKMSVGATDLMWLFHAPLGEAAEGQPDPARVRSWAGGEIFAYGRKDETAFSMTLAARTDQGQAAVDHLCNETFAWASASWGEPHSGETSMRWTSPDGATILGRCLAGGPRITSAADPKVAGSLLGRASGS